MKSNILLISLIFLCFSAFGQFTEDFSDGNFTENPVWQGNTDRYTVNSEMELQNDDFESNTTYLSVPVLTSDSASWEFYCRLEFDPSTSNQMRAYLNASQPDLSGALDGYFVQIGASSDTDAVELRRQDGSGSTLLLSTPEGSAASSPEVRVRVIRNNDNVWELLVDLTGGTNFQSYGTITDATHPFGQYFGFLNKYTSTRVDKFFFDDINIGPLFTDVIPPELLSVNVINGTSIDLEFNEAISQSSAENIANYSLSLAVNITNATLDATNSGLVHLTTEPLTNATDYTLTISNIADIENNVADEFSSNFFYVMTTSALLNDILINEILADPNPSVGLPEADFIELYNRSDNYINLENFTIQDEAVGTGVLPNFILEPNGYVIICNTDNLAAYSAFGDAIGVSNMPSFNNSDDDVILFNENGALVNSVHYYDDWYRNDNKDDGGWTLELINPNLYCLKADNWIASNNPIGGTPGAQNSVFDETPDTTPPSLVSATAFSSQAVVVEFSEIMDITILSESNTYTVNPGNINPINVNVQDNGQSVELTFATPFISEQSYSISTPTVTDCVGNLIGGQNAASFVYYETSPAEAYDIIINEIMAAPAPSHGLPELEYVELYNRSDKAISLQNYTFDEGSSSGNILPFFVLLPDSYAILQKRDFENFSDYGKVIQLDNFALTNGGELLTLYDNVGNPIDAVFYDDDWYIDGRDAGYSLERINPNNICTNTRLDWSSSFANIGGTPGAVNDIFDNTESDQTGPELTKVYLDKMVPNQLVLSFDKAVDQASLTDIGNYTITPNDLSVTSVFLSTPLYQEVRLQLSDMVPSGVIYTLELNMDIENCKGNIAGTTQSGRFAISEEIEPGDIVLNEILNNPYTGGSRFVEIYNNSDKVFDVMDLYLAKRIGADSIGFDEQVQTACLLFPEEYIVLTPNPQDIIDRYTVENPFALVYTDVPSYDDNEDVVVLMTLESVVVDELAYDREFHNALLDDKNGVSLERTSPNRPTQDIGNWHSAAATAGFATPTYVNSQFSERTTGNSNGNFISIPEKTISPDEDGFEDVLTIFYQTPESGFLANIRIYDSRGRLVKKLNQQTLLAAEGSLKWDGSTDEGLKANIGVYILVAEFTNPNGTVRTENETIVVAAKLDN